MRFLVCPLIPTTREKTHQRALLSHARYRFISSCDAICPRLESRSPRRSRPLRRSPAQRARLRLRHADDCNQGPSRRSGFKSSRTVFVFASRTRADQKVLHLLARSKLRRQPAGLYTAARPSLGRIFRIPVFGKHLRVRTPLAVRGDNLAGRPELVQPLLKSGLFHRQFARQT